MYGQCCCLYQHLSPNLHLFLCFCVACVSAGFRIPDRAVLFSASDALPGGGIPCVLLVVVVVVPVWCWCFCAVCVALVLMLSVWFPFHFGCGGPWAFPPCPSLRFPLVLFVAPVFLFCCGCGFWVPWSHFFLSWHLGLSSLSVPLLLSVASRLFLFLWCLVPCSTFQMLPFGVDPRGFEPWASHPLRGWWGPSFGRNVLGAFVHGPPWRILVNMALCFPQIWPSCGLALGRTIGVPFRGAGPRAWCPSWFAVGRAQVALRVSPPCTLGRCSFPCSLVRVLCFLLGG